MPATHRPYAPVQNQAAAHPPEPGAGAGGAGTHQGATGAGHRWAVPSATTASFFQQNSTPGAVAITITVLAFSTVVVLWMYRSSSNKNSSSNSLLLASNSVQPATSSSADTPSSSKNNKKLKESVVNKILQAREARELQEQEERAISEKRAALQAQAQAEAAASRNHPHPNRSRSPSLAIVKPSPPTSSAPSPSRERNPSTTSAFSSGLAALAAVATGAVVGRGPSTSSDASRSNSGAVTPTKQSLSPPFDNHYQPVVSTGAGSGKKGKKAKGLAPPILASFSTTTTPNRSNLSSPLHSPSASPSRRSTKPSMKNIGVVCQGPSTLHVSVQTSPPNSPPPPANGRPPRLGLVLLDDERTAPGTFPIHFHDSSFIYPPLPESPFPTYELPPFEFSPLPPDVELDPPPSTSTIKPSPSAPIPKPTSFKDADVQTSPSLLPVRRTPVHFDLHASFQSTTSTPSTRTNPPPPPPPLLTSPPPSPSPKSSSSNLPLPLSLHPTPSSSPSNISEKSSSAARRKQSKKNSAAQQQVQQQHVVGLPRPARSREPTDESEPSNGGVLTSPTLGRSQRGSVSGGPSSSSGGTAQLMRSPEMSAMGLPMKPLGGATVSLKESGGGGGKGRGGAKDRERERERERGDRERGDREPRERDREREGGDGRRSSRSGPSASSITGMANGSGLGRYGIPAPIPIPPSHVLDPYPSGLPTSAQQQYYQQQQRRMSTISNASSTGAAGGLSLMSMGMMGMNLGMGVGMNGINGLPSMNGIVGGSATSSSNLSSSVTSTSSTSSSPYLSHSQLMALTSPTSSVSHPLSSSVSSVASTNGLTNGVAPLKTDHGKKGTGGKTDDSDEAYWRMDLRNERAVWDPEVGVGGKGSVVGLGLGAGDHHPAEGAESNAAGKSRSDGRTWSEAAGARSGRRGSTSSRASSMSGTHASMGDAFFPPSGQTSSSATELLSPPTSPDPAPAAPFPHNLLQFQAMATAAGRPWSPQIAGAQYSMVPFTTSTQPVPGGGSNSSGVTNAAQGSSAASGTQSRPSSRQSSLSVPVSSSRDQQQQSLQQQQAHLQQQQQAYVFAHAQAQAQYHHAVAMQLHAQQLHAQQLTQRQQRLQQEQLQLQQQQAAATAQQMANATGGGEVSSTPAPAQTPVRPTVITSSASLYQTPLSAGSSLSAQANQTWPTSISPTSATFPPGYAQYLASPSTPFLNTGSYHLSTSQTSSQGGQSNGSNRQSVSSKGGGSGQGRTESRKTSPRIGGPEKKTSPTAVVNESTGWKIKLRTAEMEADRNGKELEIARWRLAVLEEERIASEIENQEALAALANRAKRAEARLKLLEEARQQDSSSASASGSGSPNTRPSSIIENTEGTTSESAPVSNDDDSLRFASPPGVPLHPLAWLDLDTVNFTVPIPHPSKSHFMSSHNNSNGRKNRNNRYSTGPEVTGGANGGNGRRKPNNQRRRSTNSHALDPADADRLANGGTLGDEDDDDVVIVIDTPIRRRPGAARAPSRRSSYIQDEDGQSSLLDASFGEDDDVSNVDLDEMDDEERVHLDYTGFLPTFLTTHPSSGSIVDQATGTSPRSQDPVNSSESELDPDSSLVSIPSFVLDCATPSPMQEVTPVVFHDEPYGEDEEEEQTPQLSQKSPKPEIVPSPSPEHESASSTSSSTPEAQPVSAAA
ncbi:hypothetical protein T439DRAFT_381884 [Meredithblackwellia eburnea MCA 4105]